MTLLMKGVKPKRLKEDVFRLEFLTGIREIERAIIKELKKTTRTWKGEKPKFEGTRSLSRGEIALVVGPAGSQRGAQKWQWLDEGTRKNYPILPVRARMLRFRGVYVAKTTPGVFESKNGGASGDYVFSPGVIHPGIKARGWSKMVAKRFRPRFRRRMEKALRIARKKSGQAV